MWERSSKRNRSLAPDIPRETGLPIDLASSSPSSNVPQPKFNQFNQFVQSERSTVPILTHSFPMQTTESPNESIALLIDADNSPAAKIDFIIAELASYGVVNIRRAYGNWKKEGLKGWEAILHEYAIQPIQHFDITKGKNATDMGLIIDAMDILYTKQVETFCLVSSDGDFTPLILRLRSDGKQVIGFGGQKTPSPFVNSCTRFLFSTTTRESKLCARTNPPALIS